MVNMHEKCFYHDGDTQAVSTVTLGIRCQTEGPNPFKDVDYTQNNHPNTNTGDFKKMFKNQGQHLCETVLFQNLYSTNKNFKILIGKKNPIL